MNKSQTLTQLLGISYPIFQGAMSQVSRHPLVAAVSNAGGLGILASNHLSGEEMRSEIQKTRALTDKPFGVNLMMMAKNIDEIVQVVIEEKVPIVTSGAGSPKKYISDLQATGIKVIPVIASVKHAVKMAELGADALVAEGMEAGGHIGEMTTMALLPQIVDAVEIPVIAAGGIGDGRGLAAALMLGASGVQMGTRFLATEECPISNIFKELVLEAKDTDTIITGKTSGHPVRCIRNSMTERYSVLEHGPIFDKEWLNTELEKLALGSLAKAVHDGDRENGSFMAGQISGMVQEIISCQALIDQTIQQARQVMAEVSL